jgi:HK97 family phage portal protein
MKIFGFEFGNKSAPVEIVAPAASAPIQAAAEPVVKGTSGFEFVRGLDILDGATAAKPLVEPYKNSAWVMQAIKQVSNPIAAVPLHFATDDHKGDAPLTDSAVNAFWRRPARGLTRHDFFEATVGWIKLCGNAFWVLGDEWLTSYGTRTPFRVVRPDSMKEIVEGQELVGWRHFLKNGRVEYLLAEQVIHLKTWNPYDNIWGLAEWEAARIATESDYMAAKFNRTLMANNGDTGAYISSKGTISEEQQKQITAQLRAKRQAAARGDFRSVFLTGDVSVSDPKIQVPDVAFTTSRLQNRHEIALAFGVPPSMFDIVASYSVGSASDRYRLIEETCMPLAEKIADAIEIVTEKLTAGKKVFAWFHWDEHSVMQAVRRERIDAAVKLWGTGMPMEKVNDFMDLGMPEFKGWDIGYISFGLTPVGESLQPETDPALNEDAPKVEEDETDKKIAAAIRALDPAQRAIEELEKKATAKNQPKKKNCSCGVADISGAIALAEGKDKKRAALWRSHMSKRASAINTFMSKFNAELIKARGEVLANLQQAKKSVAADFMFDLAKFSAGLRTAMRKAQLSTLQTAGDQLYTELGKDDPWSMPPELAKEFLRNREKRITNVADNVFADIKAQLEAGLDDGETMDQLQDRVRSAFNIMARSRARTIASTETSAAYGVARQGAMKSAGVKFKQWLTSGNENVRDAHADAEGQVVGISENFEVGGESLAHPGDPSGAPENVINCHCVSIPVSSEDGNTEEDQ